MHDPASVKSIRAAFMSRRIGPVTFMAHCLSLGMHQSDAERELTAVKFDMEPGRFTISDCFAFRAEVEVVDGNGNPIDVRWTGPRTFETAPEFKANCIVRRKRRYEQ